jgi:hypothetical protein
MDLPLSFFVAVWIFASWRIACLLARESGPWDILGKMRVLVGVRYDEKSEPYGTTELAKAIICVYCSSVWIAAALVGVYVISPEVSLAVSLPFAISGGVILLEELV